VMLESSQPFFHIPAPEMKAAKFDPRRRCAQQAAVLRKNSIATKGHLISKLPGGALHIEPGIWVTQPATTAPPEQPPIGQQIVARMATIPHGTCLVGAGLRNSSTIADERHLPDHTRQYSAIRSRHSYARCRHTGRLFTLQS
jgi:hypothetical protein